MEFLKKHYEKAILSVVLLGLAVVAALLPMKVTQVRADLQEATRTITGRKAKELPRPDLSTNLTILTRVRSPRPVTFAASGHNVFNPITWKRKADGTPVPSEQFGLSSLVVTNLNPLHLKIEFRGGRVIGGDLRLEFMMTREAATNASLRGPLPRGVSVGGRTEVFIVKELLGTREEPAGAVLELNDSKRVINVTKEQPFTEIEGYTADLRYEAESRNFLRQREGQKISFAGSTYNIIAIRASEVTLEDVQTKKRTTIALKAPR